MTERYTDINVNDSINIIALRHILAGDRSSVMVLAIWGFALTCMAIALFQSHKTLRESASIRSSPRIVMQPVRSETAGLSQDQIRDIVSRFSSEEVAIAPGRNGALEIRTQEGRDYQKWSTAIFEILATYTVPDRHIRWSMTSFCGGQSCQGGYFTAVLVPEIRTLKIDPRIRR